MKKVQFVILVLQLGLVFSLSANNNQTDSLLRAVETAKDTALVNSYIRIASAYRYTNSDTAVYYLRQAEKEATEINFDKGIADALFMQGNMMYFNNNYFEGNRLFTRCMELAEEMNDKLLKAKCLERLASIHLATDNSNKALKYYYNSLALFEELNNLQGIAKVYNILGIYKADNDEFHLAETYLNKSLAINQRLNKPYNIIENKVNLGYIFERSGNIEKAEKIYTELISELQETNYINALSVIYFNLTSIYQKKGETTKAMDFLFKAIDISEQAKDSAMLSSLYGNAGELYIELGKLDSAKVYLKRSIVCSRSIKDIETEINALQFMARIDSMLGDLNAELSTYKKLISLKDIFHDQQFENNLKESELRYENLKHQNQIALQEKTIATEKSNKRLFIWLFAVSILAFLVLGWFFVLLKKTKEKNRKLHDQQIKINQIKLESAENAEKLQKLEKETIEGALKLKERELVSMAMQMEQSKIQLNFIRLRIKNLINKEDAIPALENLHKEIKRKLKDLDNWDLFYNAFNELHTDFFNHLKGKHPTLTRSEMKYCAYIRINLSSNQLASLLNVSIDAVRKTRYRIRKKLKLQPDDSLENYLLKF